MLVFKEAIHLKHYSTIEIGGPAKRLVEVFSKEDIKEALAFATSHNLPYHLVGRGSNTLFSDQGFDGLVIVNRYSLIKELSPGQFLSGSGTSLPLISMKTASRGWRGLEWALGIPGSVGGAIVMNAGASGSDMAGTLEEVLYLHPDGTEERIKREAISFGYRTSPFQKMKGVVLEAIFSLKEDPGARDRQLFLFQERRKVQPYHEPSLGCVFQNPEGHSCGKLVEELGLKGSQAGGAHISPLHGNFITNPNGGTAADVLSLIQLIEETMMREKKLPLKREIRIVPPQ